MSEKKYPKFSSIVIRIPTSMLLNGKLVKSSLTAKQKNPKTKKGVKSIKLKTDDNINTVKIENKGEVVAKPKKKADKPKKKEAKKSVKKNTKEAPKTITTKEYYNQTRLKIHNKKLMDFMLRNSQSTYDEKEKQRRQEEYERLNKERFDEFERFRKQALFDGENHMQELKGKLAKDIAIPAVKNRKKKTVKNIKKKKGKKY